MVHIPEMLDLAYMRMNDAVKTAFSGIQKSYGITPFELLGWSYFDMKQPNIGKEVQEYEAFKKHLVSLGYSVKINPESLDGEELSITIVKGKGTKAVILNEEEMSQFQAEIMKAVEFALFQREQK